LKALKAFESFFEIFLKIGFFLKLSLSLGSSTLIQAFKLPHGNLDSLSLYGIESLQVFEKSERVLKQH
jgi:hypothetical protein